MECYRVHIPDGAKVSGVTASGQPTFVLPGEYLVHLLRPKVGVHGQTLVRFVGADAAGHDVHVTAGSLLELTTLCVLPAELLEQDRNVALAA